MASDLLTSFVSLRLIGLHPATPRRMVPAPQLARHADVPGAVQPHTALTRSSEELHIAMRHINVPHNSNRDPESSEAIKPSRRRFLQSAAAAAAVTAAPLAHAQQPAATSAPPPSMPNTAAPLMPVKLTINGHAYEMQLEARTTLLDALREYAGLTGTKKGCDRGQCGACTVHHRTAAASTPA